MSLSIDGSVIGIDTIPEVRVGDVLLLYKVDIPFQYAFKGILKVKEVCEVVTHQAFVKGNQKVNVTLLGEPVGQDRTEGREFLHVVSHAQFPDFWNMLIYQTHTYLHIELFIFTDVSWQTLRQSKAQDSLTITCECKNSIFF